MRETKPKTVCEHNDGVGANIIIGWPFKTNSHKCHSDGINDGPKQLYRPTSWNNPRCSWTYYIKKDIKKKEIYWNC